MSAPGSKGRTPKAPRRPRPAQRYTDELGPGPGTAIAGSSSSPSAIPLLAPYAGDDDDEELPGYVSDPGADYGGTAVAAATAVNRGAAVGAGGGGGAGAGAGAGGGDDIDAPPGFEEYRPVVKKIKTRLGMGDTLLVSHDKHLNTDGEALYRWLLQESRNPPRPEIHIQGYHTVSTRNGDKTKTSTVTDFNFKIDLRYRLVKAYSNGAVPQLKTADPRKKTSRGGRWKTVAADLEEARTVRSWADQYCEDKSTLKEFIMKKSCVGWDLEWLERNIAALIRATNYRGRIKVDFPVFEARVEVYPDNCISRMRKTECWRWFFYLTFLWTFSWPYLWCFTKRYHVAETVWNYAHVRPRSRMSPFTEADWLNLGWGEVIKRAAKARRTGRVTHHDLEEVLNRAAAGSQGEMARTPKTGNTTVDSALGFIAGVGAIANDMGLSVSEIVGWDEIAGWGADESW
ncbi:hypothetical protein DFP73DRAFT_15928 [Morchella snyderi]|nr:hypothetical protein DFP73DRAFT_15928 [Morchella snyderi]